MIFRQWRQVLDGTKTQTRRLCKVGDRLYHFETYEGNELKVEYWVEDVPGRRRWCTWRTYSVQPKRGKRSIGRIHIMGFRWERVRDISLSDVFAEGVGIVVDGQLYPITVLDVAREEFARLWDGIHEKPGERFEDNPEVWVITFLRR